MPNRDRKRDFRRLDFDGIFDAKEPDAPVSTMLFRSEVLEKVGGFDTKSKLEDLLIALRITHAGYFINVLPEVIAKYRGHCENTHKTEVSWLKMC